MQNKDDQERGPQLWRVPSPGDDRENKDKAGGPPQPEYTRQQRRWAALGALKAALLIGAAYLVGLGIIIGLMVLFW